MEVCRKATSIVLSMTSTRNVEEVVLSPNKQLQRTQEHDYEKVLLLFFDVEFIHSAHVLFS